HAGLPRLPDRVRARRRAALAAVLISLVAAGAGTAAPRLAEQQAGGCTAPSPGDHEVAVEPGRAPVVLHVPPGPATRRRALVLVLPGAGQTGRDIERYTGYSRLADQRGFLVAYPTA